jgi:hypothetical protein
VENTTVATKTIQCLRISSFSEQLEGPCVGLERLVVPALSKEDDAALVLVSARVRSRQVTCRPIRVFQGRVCITNGEVNK